MAKYAAFLRGINLGGRRVSNAELRAHFEALGFEDVRSFRASGNIVFSAGEEPAAELQARIEAGLAESLGYDVLTFLRTAREVRAIAAHEPFDAEHIKASAGKLQVSLLASAPSAAARKAVLALASAQDRLAFGARELYWLPSGGTIDSPLDLKTIAAALGPTTMRTKATVELIAEKHCAE